MVQKFNRSTEIFVDESFEGKNKARLKRKETETTETPPLKSKGIKTAKKVLKIFVRESAL